MALPDLKPGTKVHFVGIGGVGMSALAELLLSRGCLVSGSDREASAITERLSSRGARVTTGHSAEAVGGAALVVFTPAVGEHNAEVVEARRRGLPTVRRRELLGAVTAGRKVVAVAGTHGKTTTSAMMTSVFEAAGMDPTALVGGVMKGPETNLRIGGDRVWVVEADEYDRAFLELTPAVAAVTSLEADHLDQFGTEAAVREAFVAFLGKVKPGGAAVLCADSPGAAALAKGRRPAAARRVWTYGADSPDARIRATNVRREGLGSRCLVSADGKALGEVALRVPGRHNVVNGLAAVGAALALDVPWDAIAEGLTRFDGVRRRFEVVGEAAGVKVVSDYAHHPTEIRATLAAARWGWDGPIVAVFQPHLFSRTQDFLDEFGASLAEADRVWLAEIYPARERPIPGVTGEAVAEAVRRAGRAETRFVAGLDDLARAVADSARAGEMVLVMGAGSVEKVAWQVAGMLAKGRTGHGAGAGERVSG